VFDFSCLIFSCLSFSSLTSKPSAASLTSLAASAIALAASSLLGGLLGEETCSFLSSKVAPGFVRGASSSNDSSFSSITSFSQVWSTTASLQQPTEHLPAELLAEEEEPVKEAVVDQTLEKEVIDEKEESFEDEAPLTKPGATLDDKKEQVSSPRRPPNKEEAAKAIAEAAKEVKEAAEGLEVKEEKDRQDKIKQEKKTKLEKEEKAKREKIKADKILAEKAKLEKREAEKVRQEKLLADKVATTPKKTAAELAGEWGDDDEDSSSAADKAVTTPTGTMSDKPKRERKLPAKLLD
jgi:hypothetical protein